MHTMKRLALIVLLSFCAFFLSSTMIYSADREPAHQFRKDQCSSCHVFPDGEESFTSGNLFRRDIGGLCLTCHSGDRMAGVGHRIGMVPSMTVPEDFLLDRRGRMTCATCHDTHRIDGKIPHLLRRYPGQEFCMLCHSDGIAMSPPPAVTITFPPENAVLSVRDTAVAGTVNDGALEVTLTHGDGSTTVPVIGGYFASSVTLHKGENLITIGTEAGGEDVGIVLTRAGGKADYTPHLTSGTGQCAACHNDWEKAGFFSPSPPAENCYSCHPRLDRQASTHQPIALGECSLCHDPHGTAIGGAREPCLACHEGTAAERHLLSMNAPGEEPAVACGECHDSHQSSRPFLVIATATSLVVTAEFSAPSPNIIRGEDGLSDITLPGFALSGDVGEPMLPVKTATVAVPAGADPATARLHIIDLDERPLPLRRRVRPVPPAVAYVEGRRHESGGDGSLSKEGTSLKTYSKNVFFPSTPVTLAAAAGLRGISLVNVTYHPVRYNPVSGDLLFARRVVVEVEFDREKKGKAPVEGIMPSSFRRLSSSWVSNISQAGNRLKKSAEGGKVAMAGAEQADYLIVTTRSIAGASSQLPAFIDHKVGEGFRVKVVDEDDYGDSPAGQERAIAIRTWLKNNYLSLGTEYVLLLGDPTPESGGVPMLRAWPRNDATTYIYWKDAPTDYFYADLTGDWDRDGDGYYGEFLPAGGGTEGDLVPEVFVGRIPVYDDNIAELDAILAKTIAYESAPGNTDWRRSVLLPMSFVDSATDGAWLAEKMKEDFLLSRGFSPFTLYQQGSAGGGDSSFTSDAELRGDMAKGIWSSNPFGAVVWFGHGSPSKTMIGYGGSFDGNILSSTDTTELTDDFPSIIFQVSCLNGFPENRDNMGYSLLRTGGVATVSSSRVSWYQQTTHFDLSPGNSGLGYAFLSRLASGEKAGPSLYLGKGNPALPVPNDRYWMNMVDFNLYGDPSVGLFDGAVLRANPPSLSFTIVEGETSPVKLGLSLSTRENAAVVFEAQPAESWISAAPLDGETPTSAMVTASAAGLTVGTHSTRIMITSPDAVNSPFEVPVSIEVKRGGLIAGRITTAKGKSVAAVTVRLEGARSAETVTGKRGTYRFNQLPPGWYRLTPSGENYAFTPAQAEFTIAEGESFRRKFVARRFKVSGKVKNSKGKPVYRTAVRLLDENGVLLKQVRTNRRGAYVFGRVGPGNYTVTARHTRLTFTPETLPVAVASENMVKQNFTGSR